MIQIKIEDDLFLQAHNFAEQCAETCLSNYKRRGQGNIYKIITDIHTGKLFELGAYKLLQTIGLTPTFPDFKIYESKGKSWDADMFAGDWKIHCKGQTKESVDKYGLSWILSYGKYGTDKLFHNQTKHDLLIAGYVSNRDAIICGILPIQDIMENGLVGMPALPQLYHSKRAIYWKDLEFHYHDKGLWGPFQKAVEEKYGSQI